MQFGNTFLSLSTPRVMGILNVTPDSFSDGGKFNTVEGACERALLMVQSGADLIDVGGESTRPGAPAVSEQEELDRVIPVIEALRKQTDVIISVDTSKPAVMSAAVAAGAGLINDVRALQLEGAMEAAAACKVPVCLMHMQGEPDSMQSSPHYSNVVEEVKAFLTQRVKACHDAGIDENQILLDPGFGFGKTIDHNFSLLRNLPALAALGFPLLVGMSRKSMIGELLAREVDQRLAGSIALASIAAQSGAEIIRVHDVQETADALAIVKKLKEIK